MVFAVAPALICAPDAWLAARLCGARTWLHVQDFEIGAAGELGLLPSWAVRAAAAAERRIMGLFDRVSSISGAMARRLAEKGVSPERVRLFPNWVDTERFRPHREAGADYRRRWNIPSDVFLVLYAGNMGRKQGLDSLLGAAARLKDRNKILFALAGDGSERKALESRAAGMENVRFFPLMPEEEMPSLLNAADLHLVLQRRGAADLVMPSKLAAILAVGGRALVTADAATELGILAGENPGIYEMVSPEDEEALSRAVERAAGWPSTPCLPARAYAVEHLSRTGILGALEKDLSSLAAR